MNQDKGRGPVRDMEVSSFGEIIGALLCNYKQVKAAVFYDREGETIDYYSFQDAFTTRLAAALHGVIFESTRAKLNWLKMGNIELMEINASELDSMTIPIGQEYYFTVIVSHGAADSSFYEIVLQVAVMLREEIGY